MNKRMDSLCSTLREDVDWDKFFRIVEHTGDDLNSRKDRFDKSDIFELSLQRCSSGNVVWVDKIGWDHEVEH